MDLEELFQEYTEEHYGFSHPRWGEVWDYLVRVSPDPDVLPRFGLFRDRWLEEVAKALRPPGVVAYSKTCVVIAPDAEQGAKLVRFFDEILGRIAEILPHLVRLDQLDPLHAIVLDGDEQYYNYVSYFDGPGATIASEGVCILTQFPHFVQRKRELWQMQSTASHEIVHYCMTPFAIPLWLNEGLAMTLEAVLMSQPTLTLSPARWDEHRRHWNPSTIQAFWQGRAFKDPVSSELAYELGRMCVKTLGQDPEAFADFVRLASWEDAGAAAAVEIFGRPIEGLLEQFFGAGAWAPVPAGWGEA